MIIVLKQHSGQKEIDRVENLIKTKGLDTHIVKGAGQTIIGCIGDTSRIDAKLFETHTLTKLSMYRSLTNWQTVLSTRKTLL